MIRELAARLAGHLRRVVGTAPHAVQAAALPWRRTEHGIEVLLVTGRDRGRWILPKGWPGRGESLPRAAEREAFEEAGIRGRIGETAIGSYRRGGRRRPPVEIFVFPLEVDKVADKWPERKQRQRRWLTPDKAAMKIHDPALAGIVRSFAGERSGA